jgi:hypothetical protein
MLTCSRCSLATVFVATSCSWHQMIYLWPSFDSRQRIGKTMSVERVDAAGLPARTGSRHPVSLPALVP